jgi:predicted dehydrogenase
MISRVLIAGAGAIAHFHAAAARTLTPPPPIMAADPSDDSRANFQKAFPEAVVLRSVEELFATPAAGSEVAIVATPPFLHFPHAMAALKSGRHILVEKPLVIEAADAEALLAEAQSRGLELACCSSRFSSRPITGEIRRRVFAGEIGEGWRVRWQVRGNGIPGIGYQPESRWFLDRSKAGGGSLLDWGCYDLAIWTEIFRPVKISVDAAWIGFPRRGETVPDGIVFDVEHQVTAHLRLHLEDERVVPVFFERSSTGYGGDLHIMQIEGARGCLDWDAIDFQGHKIRWFHENAPGDHVVDETAFEGTPDEPHFHHRPLLALAKRLSEHPSPDISGCQAVFNFLVLDAVYQVAREGKPQSITLNQISTPSL